MKILIIDNDCSRHANYYSINSKHDILIKESYSTDQLENIHLTHNILFLHESNEKEFYFIENNEENMNSNMKRYFFTGRNDGKIYIQKNKAWYIRPSDIKQIIEDL